MIKGHHTDDCDNLKREIERLIQKGHLKNYFRGALNKGVGLGTKGDTRPEAPDLEKTKSHKDGGHVNYPYT